MKVSELIKGLEDIRQGAGDVEVYIEPAGQVFPLLYRIERVWAEQMDDSPWTAVLTAAGDTE